MKKIVKVVVLFLSLFLFVFNLTSCEEEVPTGDVTETPSVDQKQEIYKMAVASGYTGTYEEWLASIKGDTIELSVEDGYLVWKYKTESTWRQLLNINSLKGDNGQMGPQGLPGKPGKDGVDGKNPEFRVNEGYLEWKYTDDTEWIKLYKISNVSSGTGSSDNQNSGNQTTDMITVTFVTEWDASNYYIVPLKWVEVEMPAGKITVPDNLIPEGYVCANWYYLDKNDPENMYVTDFDHWKFNMYYAFEDITLYAKIVKEINITFLDENGNVLYEEYCKEDNSLLIEHYILPENKDEIFLYWADVENEENHYNAGFRAQFEKDTVLKPVFIKDNSNALKNTTYSKNLTAHYSYIDEEGNQPEDTWGFTLAVDGENGKFTMQDEGSILYFKNDQDGVLVYEDGQYHKVKEYNIDYFTLCPFPSFDNIPYYNFGIYDEYYGTMTEIAIAHINDAIYDEETGFYTIYQLSAKHGRLDSHYVEGPDNLTFSYKYKLSNDNQYVETVIFEILSSELGLTGLRMKIDFYDYGSTTVVMPE